MRKPKQRVQTRTIAAVSLICASFLSAYVLSSMANRTELLWSAKTSLAPGVRISLSNLTPKRIAIPDGFQAYIRASENINDFVVVRSVGAGELLPSMAVTSNSLSQQMSSVPVSVHASDLPADLATGEIVNLYHVGDSHLAKEFGPPNLVISHAYILAVDRKGQNLGGDLTLTLSVNTKFIMQVLDATASGRIVVVRTHG